MVRPAAESLRDCMLSMCLLVRKGTPCRRSETRGDHRNAPRYFELVVLLPQHVDHPDYDCRWSAGARSIKHACTHQGGCLIAIKAPLALEDLPRLLPRLPEYQNLVPRLAS
jgi:hypothetical protein